MDKNGYATLTIDKLENGKSYRPDHLAEVKLPLQMETIYDLIVQVTAGKTRISVPPRIICVSHSSGSSLRADLAQTHPEDVNTLALTGYQAGVSNNPGGMAASEYLPAAICGPDRFPNLNYGYFLMGSEFDRTMAGYFQGHYDSQTAPLDYLTEGTQPLGERFNLGPEVQPSFKGKVLVVTGSRDPLICGYTPVDQCAYNDTVIKAVNLSFCGNTRFDFYLLPVAMSLIAIIALLQLMTLGFRSWRIRKLRKEN